MTLPKRPSLNQPIPNENIPNVPEQYTVKAPYWDAVIEGDLTIGAEGALELTGGYGDGDPNTQIQAAWWGAPIGAGLTVNEAGELVPGVSPYIYCTPQYSDLPVTYPPYGCNTEVNTAGVTDFSLAWNNCQYLTEFPCVDSSSVTDFYGAWYACYGLTSFPLIDTGAGENFQETWSYSRLTSFPKLNTSSGVNFSHTWSGCYYLTEFPELDTGKGEDFSFTWYGCSGLTSFPLINTGSGENFEQAWLGCGSLTSFPELDVSSGQKFGAAWNSCSSLTSFPSLNVSSGTEFWLSWTGCSSLTSFPALDLSLGTDFYYAWAYCSSLISFPANMFDSCSASSPWAFLGTWQNCALNQQSVDNILVSLDTSGILNKTTSLAGGTSSSPGAAGLVAKTSLQGKGWTVITN